jgi:hypothetical protein
MVRRLITALFEVTRSNGAAECVEKSFVLGDTNDDNTIRALEYFFWG